MNRQGWITRLTALAKRRERGDTTLAAFTADECEELAALIDDDVKVRCALLSIASHGKALLAFAHARQPLSADVFKKSNELFDAAASLALAVDATGLDRLIGQETT